MFLISRCCVGMACRYKGTGFLRQIAVKLGKGEDFVAVCPEQLGGLPTPREGCSVVRGKVVGRRTGHDFTEQYLLGAIKTLEICQREGITTAYLLKNSPSCGKGYGVTARLLEEHGITVLPI